MNKTTFWPKRKLLVLIGMLAIYAAIGTSLALLVSMGQIQKTPDSKSITGITGNSVGASSLTNINPASEAGTIRSNLRQAQAYFQLNMVRPNGHVILYLAAGANQSLQDNNTNSEAVSYYLLWSAVDGNKTAFDKELDFVQKNMLEPNFGYMMWRLQPDDSVVKDGSNIASDADLRAIKALLIAEKRWNDDNRYSGMINQLASGLEKVAITKDGYLAPYGGVSGKTSSWTAKEVWLSYTDFTVINELAKRRGEPWRSVYDNMKKAALKAQLENSLYNSMLTEDRKYGNGIDDGGYSINSMWMMVRNAESRDPELMQSANESLQFYKKKFIIDAELYAKYGSNGDALSPYDTPWVYALVGRAAIELGDREFSQEMVKKLTEHQATDYNAPLYGAFPEGEGNQTRVGQFTMQESILTMQDYLDKHY